MPTRNRKLQQLKKRYPNINKFPLRQDPLHMENMQLMGKTVPTRFAKPQMDANSIMQNLWKKQFSPIHRCPKCGNHLKFIMINMLAKAIGVYHQGSELFCPGCGKGYRFMLERDNAMAESIRRKNGIPVQR